MKMELTKHKKGGSKGGNAYGSYQVRYASDKQKNFIKKLLEQKEHDVDIDLSSLNVQGAGELITKLLLLPDKVGFVNYASDKQINFVMGLVESKENGQLILNTYLQHNNTKSVEQLTKQQVSLLISALKATEDKKPTITEVGAYLYEGVIYSIRKTNTNNKLVIYSYDEFAGKYLFNHTATKNLLNKIEPQHRLTLEQAIKYSAHTGICVHCGRTLTLLKSVAGGMGAWCAKKYH